MASISGLKAMQSLTKYQRDPKTPCKEMMLLVILKHYWPFNHSYNNDDVKTSYGSHDILGFFGYSLTIGFIITIVGIIASKVIEHYG